MPGQQAQGRQGRRARAAQQMRLPVAELAANVWVEPRSPTANSIARELVQSRYFCFCFMAPTSSVDVTGLVSNYRKGSWVILVKHAVYLLYKTVVNCRALIRIMQRGWDHGPAGPAERQYPSVNLGGPMMAAAETACGGWNLDVNSPHGSAIWSGTGRRDKTGVCRGTG